MSFSRGMFDALFSTQPIAGRPMSLYAIFIGGGGMLINGPSLVLGHREPISTYCGLSVSLLGLLLASRYCVARAKARRARHPSSTKAL